MVFLNGFRKVYGVVGVDCFVPNGVRTFRRVSAGVLSGLIGGL